MLTIDNNCQTGFATLYTLVATCKITSIGVSFLASVTHLNLPTTCSYNKLFLHSAKVTSSLFWNNFTDSNCLHISLKIYVLPRQAASQI